jgi:hypothetical protein
MEASSHGGSGTLPYQYVNEGAIDEYLKCPVCRRPCEQPFETLCCGILFWYYFLTINSWYNSVCVQQQTLHLEGAKKQAGMSILRLNGVPV